MKKLPLFETYDTEYEKISVETSDIPASIADNINISIEDAVGFIDVDGLSKYIKSVADSADVPITPALRELVIREFVKTINGQHPSEPSKLSKYLDLDVEYSVATLSTGQTIGLNKPFKWMSHELYELGKQPWSEIQDVLKKYAAVQKIDDHEALGRLVIAVIEMSFMNHDTYGKPVLALKNIPIDKVDLKGVDGNRGSTAQMLLKDFTLVYDYGNYKDWVDFVFDNFDTSNVDMSGFRKKLEYREVTGIKSKINYIEKKGVPVPE